MIPIESLKMQKHYTYKQIHVILTPWERLNLDTKTLPLLETRPQFSTKWDICASEIRGISYSLVAEHEIPNCLEFGEQENTHLITKFGSQLQCFYENVLMA